MRTPSRLEPAFRVLAFALALPILAPTARAGNELVVAQLSSSSNVVTMSWPLVGPQVAFPTTFLQPNSIRLGPNRCIYVAEYGNKLVRRLFPDGTLDAAFDTTFGPLAGSSQSNLLNPGDVAFESDGHMFVSDVNTGRVIQYDLAAGTWVDLFPSISGRPEYLLLDGAGNLLIGDFQNGNVLSHPTTPDSFAPTIFASGLSGPQAMAWGPDGNLYVANYGGGTVERFTAAGVSLGTFAPVGTEIDSPHALAFGADGKLYVGERGVPKRIIRYGLTAFGTGTLDPTFSIPMTDPYAMLFRQTGLGTLEDVLVTYRSDDSVRRFDMRTGEAVGTGDFLSPTLAPDPHSIRMDSNGRIYVCTSVAGVGQVDRYEWDGTPLGTLILPGSGGLSFPEDLCFGPGPDPSHTCEDCNVYVADYANGRILRYDRATGAFIGVFASGCGLAHPDFLMFGPNHDLYVVDHGTGKVLRFDGCTGACVSSVSIGGSPEGMDFGPDGNLYVAVPPNVIMKLSPALTAPPPATFATITNIEIIGIHGLQFGPDANLYVTNYGSSEVLALGGPFATFPDSPGLPLSKYADGVFCDGTSLGIENPLMVLFRPTNTKDAVPFAEPGTEFCGGDHVDPVVTRLCPCNNFGDKEHGCENSNSTGGALLTGAGLVYPSDTVVLECSGATKSGLCVFVQAKSTVPAGVLAGDGIRCIATGLKRLAIRNALCGRTAFPQTGDPSITARSATLGDVIPSGGVRYYQVYYRDPAPAFCPASSGGSTFNMSNAYAVQW